MDDKTMELTIHMEPKEGKEWIRFEGHINEDAEVALPELLGKITGDCIFDFKGVTAINSCGIRAWITFLREAEKKGKHHFAACTPIVVSQMNMIPSFRDQCKIDSVYAGYSCPKCQHREQILLESGINLPKKLGDPLPEIPCPSCNTAMEMEELEEEFFAWLEDA